MAWLAMIAATGFAARGGVRRISVLQQPDFSVRPPYDPAPARRADGGAVAKLGIVLQQRSPSPVAAADGQCHRCRGRRRHRRGETVEAGRSMTPRTGRWEVGQGVAGVDEGPRSSPPTAPCLRAGGGAVAWGASGLAWPGQEEALVSLQLRPHAHTTLAGSPEAAVCGGSPSQTAGSAAGQRCRSRSATPRFGGGSGCRPMAPWGPCPGPRVESSIRGCGVGEDGWWEGIFFSTAGSFARPVDRLGRRARRAGGTASWPY